MPAITSSPALPTGLANTDRVFVERAGVGPYEAPVSEIVALAIDAFGDSADFATAAQGAKADSALQPGVIPPGTSIPLAQVSGASTALSGKADLIGGKLDPAQVPDIAIQQYLGAVATQAAMLALVGQAGDWCSRTDTGTDWRITGNPAVIGGWLQTSYPSAPVSSVNGKSGAVTLVPGDIGAATAAQGAKADTAVQPAALVSKADLVGGKLDPLQLPDIAITDYLGAVATQAAMLALTGQRGDWCSRSDTGTVYIITGASPAVIGGWTQLAYPASAVQSVCGLVGTITAAQLATALAGLFATPAQGAKADSALQDIDGINAVLAVAAPAKLAVTQSLVSGADYIATTIGGFTLAQIATAKLPKFFTATANQDIAVTYGSLSLRLSSSGGVSLEFAFDHTGLATVISKTTASTNSSSYRYNFAYATNVFQKAHLALNINDAGAMQEVTLTDMTANKIYVCVMLVGQGAVNNFFSITQVK